LKSYNNKDDEEEGDFTAGSPLTAREMAESELRIYRRERILKHTASDPANPLIWWKNHDTQYPVLSKLAKQFLGVPATSAPSERIFSAAGNIITKKRNRLKPDISSVLVFLQQSWNYMERYKEAEIEELAIQAKQSKKIIL
jgi:hypothetical protein